MRGGALRALEAGAAASTHVAHALLVDRMCERWGGGGDKGAIWLLGDRPYIALLRPRLSPSSLSFSSPPPALPRTHAEQPRPNANTIMGHCSLLNRPGAFALLAV